jgi:hypothetical protein
MNTLINPLEQQLHLKQFEREFFNSQYDHSSVPLTSWKSTRQHCYMNAQEPIDASQKPAEKKGTFYGISWSARIVGVSRFRVVK